MTSRLGLRFSAFLLPMLAAAPAHADSLAGTRGQELSETEHQVRIRVRDGVATFRVRRTFENAGKLHEEAVLGLGMPFGAAATGLRILTPSGWYDGELMRAERATRIYRELTGFGPHTVKDPALLSWRWANELELRVFPVAPQGGTSTVQYTLTAPTRYQDGRYIVTYPVPTASLSKGSVKITGERRSAKVWLDGKPIQSGVATVLAAPEVPEWATNQPLPERYAASALVIPAGTKATKLTVDIDVRHTYRGDLTVQLAPPSGKWHSLVSRDGGGDNDIRQKVTVDLTSGGKGAPVPVGGTWRLVVGDEAALDVGTIDGFAMTVHNGESHKELTAKDTPQFIPDAPSGEAGNMAVFQVEPPPIRNVAARLGRVEASKKKQFFRLEVDAAPQLRPLPKQPNVVFVVDASKSAAGHGLTQQLNVVRSFLQNAPDAKAELVVYRRRATRLFGKMIDAKDVPKRLDAATLDGVSFTPGNGSGLDEGVRLATDILSTEVKARKRSRMIVMLNDDLLRPAWTNDTTLAHLRRLPLRAAHVAMPTIHNDSWPHPHRDHRDDRHLLAPLASHSGGILLHIDGAGTHDKELDDVTLGLVRPTRIDHFRVNGVALPSGQSFPTVLQEGQGIREMAQLETAPSKVRLSGKIWARSFGKEVTGPLSFSQATAAFVFSHDLHGDLSVEEQVRVAFAGKAVTPVTSYLAVEPGVRPSNVGLLSLTGTGEGGGGHGEGFGLGGIGSPPPCPDYDLKEDVKKAANTCLTKHGTKSGTPSVTSLTVHTTFDEVVDVVGAKDALGRCLAEAAWTADLETCRFEKRRDKLTVQWP